MYTGRIKDYQSIKKGSIGLRFKPRFQHDAETADLPRDKDSIECFKKPRKGLPPPAPPLIRADWHFDTAVFVESVVLVHEWSNELYAGSTT